MSNLLHLSIRNYFGSEINEYTLNAEKGRNTFN